MSTGSKTFYQTITLVILLLFAKLQVIGADEPKKEEALYVQIKPSFVTNFQADRIRFIKADVAVKVRGKDTKQAIEDNLPRIKHHIIMLLGQQDLEGVSTPEGQAALKEMALEEIIAALDEEGLSNQVEEVLFTGFLVE